jgi:hypothetical protein
MKLDRDRDGSWRIRMNHELSDLIGNADIVRYIKSRRIAWLGHVMGMGEKRIPKRVPPPPPHGGFPAIGRPEREAEHFSTWCRYADFMAWYVIKYKQLYLYFTCMFPAMFQIAIRNSSKNK